MRIICECLHLNPPPIRILFFRIDQYTYPYPYLKVMCEYGYGKSNILFVSDPISECWVLDYDIHIEESIIQWNKTLNFDILSS